MDVGDTCTCVASAPQPQTGNRSRRVRTAFTARTQYRDLTRGARMELRLRHFAVLRVRLREQCDVPRLQRAPHAHLVRGFGPLRGLLGPVRRNAAMVPTGELPTEIRGPALHICSVESAMFDGGPGARGGRADRNHRRGRKGVPGGVRRTPFYDREKKIPRGLESAIPSRD